jgi:alkanesulfonate monooxygenase SsuD/methylene tetrahydromethanopterin reductase-like flavin-dependent oxidoreductase (luciferase family)
MRTDWGALMQTASLADAAGWDFLWSPDHLLPFTGPQEDPLFECYMTLAGWASHTNASRLGAMVTANTLRHPAYVAKLVSTFDHLSGGRAVLGLGAGASEEEHSRYGIEFPARVGQRLDRLAEAVPLIRELLDSGRASARGQHYLTQDAILSPLPLQGRVPLLIAGGGLVKTLSIVARFADLWAVSGDCVVVRTRWDALQAWCERWERPREAVERIYDTGVVVVRRSEAAAAEVLSRMNALNGELRYRTFAGTPEMLIERLVPFVKMGFSHFCIEHPAPYDLETIDLIAQEVRPRLAAML